MAKVNGGTFVPPYSLDSQKVIVKPFMMDVYPVTNADFKKFILKNQQWRKSNIKSIFADKNYLQHWNTDTSFAASLALSPVVNISWFAAKNIVNARENDCLLLLSGNLLQKLVKQNRMLLRILLLINGY